MEYLLQLSHQIQYEIDDIEQQIDELEQSQKPYTVQPRLNPMQDYSDEQFRKRFRLNKSLVVFLYSLIGQSLEPVTTRQNFTTDKILITLRYFATASFQLVAADFYGVSESTVCRIIPIVSEKIASLRERFIRMPTTNQELEEKTRLFPYCWHASNDRCNRRYSCKNPESWRQSKQNGFLLSKTVLRRKRSNCV